MSRRTFRAALFAAAALTASMFATSASAAPCSGVAFGVDFLGSYTCNDLGGPPGVAPNLGGIEFLDANTLLIGGAANFGAGNIQRIGVTRDAQNHIIGFTGPSTLYSTAPEIDGGLAFGPGGVLFYTGYNENLLGQIEPGSTSPDRVINLSPLGVAGSVGTLAFVPTGFAGAGQLKIASYLSNTWYSASLTPDGNGTFDVTINGLPIAVAGGPEGIVYIDGANDGFAGFDSILLSEYSFGAVGAYRIDANGDPILASRRNFLTGLGGAEGAVIDPLTGDFLFSTFGGGNRVVVISGFDVPDPDPDPVPEPGALALLGLGVVALGLRRRRA